MNIPNITTLTIEFPSEMVGPLAFVGPDSQKAAERYAWKLVMEDAEEIAAGDQDFQRELNRARNLWDGHGDPWGLFTLASDQMEIYITFGPEVVYDDQGRMQ